MEDKLTAGKEVKELTCLRVRKVICVDTEITQFLRVVVERETVGLLLKYSRKRT